MPRWPRHCPDCCDCATATGGWGLRTLPTLRPQVLQLLQVLAVLAVAALLPGCSGGPRYSSRIVQTKHGPVRGIIVQLNSRRLDPVEVFRGVPYAAPPIGPLRLAPSQPPPPWTGTRLADTFGPVCPQRMPVQDLNNRTSALQLMPRGRLLHLKELAPFLTRQSEDCLNLNIHVPGSGSRGADAPYPVIVLVHGESYEWNAGSPYDGAVLASWGHVIVVTFNYRLGILGFLRTRLGSSDLDYGTGDILTLLKWVQDNASAFGGDPKRVTLLGHDTGAALASILLLSPLSRGLFHHVVLMSGSVLSPWATVQTPWDLRGAVSHQLGCHVSAPGDQDLAPCLRRLPLEALLSVSVEPPRFLPRFGPSIPFPGLDPVRVALEKANDPFVRCPLLVGTHTTESYDDFNNQDIQYGFEEEQRNRVLRTFVRNAYVFHLNEIFSTVRNEYTDWEKPVAHPINLRDNTLEALSDGHTVAPLVLLARTHARRGGPTYLFHFAHQTRDSLYPQRLGSVRGEGLPYLLGLPLVGGEPHFPHNYSRQDVAVAEATINYICNFAKTGNPNDPRAEQQATNHKWEEDRETRSRFKDIQWEKFEMSSQLYLSITQKPRLKSHYRGHRIAVWLDLIPQLHRAGGQDVAMRHHHFHEKGERYFSGSVRAESPTQFPAVPDFLVPPTTATASGTASGTGGAECPPTSNLTELAVDEDDAVNMMRPNEVVDASKEGVVTASTNNNKANVNNDDDDNGLFHGFTPSQFFKSSLALGVTLGAGGLLLVLNVVVLVAILYQRAHKARRRKAEGSPGGSGGGSSSQDDASAASATATSSEGLANATTLTSLGVTTLPRTLPRAKQNGPLDVLQVVAVGHNGPHGGPHGGHHGGPHGGGHGGPLGGPLGGVHAGGVPPRYSGVPAAIPVAAPAPPRPLCPSIAVAVPVPPPIIGGAHAHGAHTPGSTSSLPRAANAPKKRVQIQEISV